MTQLNAHLAVLAILSGECILGQILFDQPSFNKIHREVIIIIIIKLTQNEANQKGVG